MTEQRAHKLQLEKLYKTRVANGENYNHFDYSCFKDYEIKQLKRSLKTIQQDLKLPKGFKL